MREIRNNQEYGCLQYTISVQLFKREPAQPIISMYGIVNGKLTRLHE
jgi:hypothetical protein